MTTMQQAELDADKYYQTFTDTLAALKVKCTKQNHYDFGMRTMKHILKSAG